MKKVLLAFLSGIALASSAQDVQLVSDLNSGSNSSSPAQLVTFNNKLYYFANDGSMGYELRAYDGANPPSLVYDIWPGPSGGMSTFPGANMVTMNGKLYFSAYTPAAGVELWEYDGSNNPAMVTDFAPGVDGSAPRYMAGIGNKLYFNAMAPGNLHIYDGTNPLYNASVDVANTKYFTELNGKVYFQGISNGNNLELFVYDPGTDTVSMAADIEPGNMGSNPMGLISYNGRLYFVATTTAYGQELYSYDGNTATRITDVSPGADNGVQGPAIIYNNELYFPGRASSTAQYRMYKCDLNGGNLTMIPPQTGLTQDIGMSRMIVYNGRLIFNSSTSTGGGLYSTSINMVVDIVPGFGNSIPDNLQEYNGKLYFSAQESATGRELYSLSMFPLSAGELAQPQHVTNAFPNPVTNVLNIITDGIATAKLYNISGQQVCSSTIDRKGQMTMTRLPSGTYLLQVTDEKGNATKKMIVKW